MTRPRWCQKLSKFRSTLFDQGPDRTSRAAGQQREQGEFLEASCRPLPAAHGLMPSRSSSRSATCTTSAGRTVRVRSRVPRGPIVSENAKGLTSNRPPRKFKPLDAIGTRRLAVRT